MRTDNESAILETVQPAGLGRYAVAVPIGTLLKLVYDGDSEQAALEAYSYALAHNQLPRFYERRSVVIV